MSSNVNNAPYLKQQRKFPKDELGSLSDQVDQAYVDISQCVNARTIGIFAQNSQIVTGEAWYVNGPKKQQSLRKLFKFTSAGSIPHGISFANLTNFTSCYGSFQDGNNHYGVIYGSSVPIAGQVSFYITNTSIVVLAHGTAPSISEGIIVVEWLTNI